MKAVSSTKVVCRVAAFDALLQKGVNLVVVIKNAGFCTQVETMYSFGKK